MNVAFGRYRLLERLGQGGMAEVFKAKSFGVEGFEKILVIKRILPELARSEEFTEMFVHEAKLAVRLSHANIVQVFDLGIAPGGEVDGVQQPDAYYMAMELVHGFDLATLLSRARKAQQQVPVDLAVLLASEVAKGLDHAHRRRDEQMRPLGIVHRDVSPQNVLLSFEGEVKVTDFGIAKARGAFDESREEDTRARKLRGKYGYMSPEQARGDNVDARSDLFSLGTILYECLAGVNPFSAPTTFETLRRVQACEFPPVELLRPEVPADLVALLKQAMAKSPDDRFSDAGRMYEAMLAFLYAHGSRAGANELADLVGSFREEPPPRVDHRISIADPRFADADGAAERTPVELPASRHVSLGRVGAARRESSDGLRAVSMERAAEMGERREITALAVAFPVPRGAPPPTAARDRAQAVVDRYGGRVVERDAEYLVALFGLGEPDGRDTEVATRCALVAVRATAPNASAGLHTRRVHVARDGAPTPDERLTSLTATARELARAREGRVVLSPAATRHVRATFELEPAGEAGSRDETGVTQGFLVKEVRRPLDSAGRFVGRKEELRRIGEMLAASTKRSPRLFTLRGSNGIGKTRLLYEVERRLRKGGYNVGLYIASCPPRGREFPLSGITCMLHVLAGLSEGDPPERILAVQPRLRALGLNADEVAAVMAVLGAPSASPSGNAKGLLRSAFTRMVASLCEDRPHTFAWDRADSMDEDSFSILQSAFARLPTARLVFAFTARAGFTHALERLAAHATLDLEDLSPDEVERLLALRLDVETVPEELLRFVRERAGGHPLFVEEIVKGLVDARALSVAERRVVSMRLVGQDLALPKTLRGLVASRVARLGRDERTALQAAAVLGDPFAADVLAEMLGQPVVTVDRTLAALKRGELLVDAGPREVRFASPIAREVVLDAMPVAASRQMHAAAADALEAVLGEGAWEHASGIAHHHYEAGDRDRAADYFARSGARRVEARQLDAATRDLTRALDLCDVEARSTEELTRWLELLAVAVRLVRTAPEATSTCDRVVARVDDAGDVDQRLRARIAAGQILSAVHLFDQARSCFAEAEAIADREPSRVRRVLAADAELSSRQGDFQRAHDLLTRMQRIMQPGGDMLEEHKTLCGLAQAHAALGDPRAATQALQAAEKLLPLDAAAACERQKVRALVEYFSRDFRAAAAASERAVDISRELGLTYEVMVNLHNLGDALIRLDDYARAYGALQQSLALCDESGFERLGNLNRAFLAFLDAAAGDANAEQLLRQGIRYAEANGFVWDVIGSRALLAQLLQRRSDVHAAREEYLELRDLARAAGNRLIEADCAEALARALP